MIYKIRAAFAIVYLALRILMMLGASTVAIGAGWLFLKNFVLN